MRYLKTLFNGETYRLVAEIVEGRCKVEEAIETLLKKNLIGALRITRLLEDIARHGVMDKRPDEYKPIRDGLYEIKERGGLFRILGFHDTKRNRFIVLARAFEKNPGKGSKSKQQDEQIRLALKFKQEYEREVFTILEK